MEGWGVEGRRRPPGLIRLWPAESKRREEKLEARGTTGHEDVQARGLEVRRTGGGARTEVRELESGRCGQSGRLQTEASKLDTLTAQGQGLTVGVGDASGKNWPSGGRGKEDQPPPCDSSQLEAGKDISLGTWVITPAGARGESPFR